ncbi:MAG: hypothetical protein PSX81_16285 [bacterium]|nr:hypothetical protein [bacterium]
MLWFIIAITQVSYFLSVKDIQLLVLKLLTSFMLSVALYSLYFGSYYGYYYYLGTHRPFKLIARVNSVTKDNRGWTLNCRSHTFKKSMRLDGAMHSQMLKGGVENYCVHFDVFEGENKIIYWESYEIKPCE